MGSRTCVGLPADPSALPPGQAGSQCSSQIRPLSVTCCVVGDRLQKRGRRLVKDPDGQTMAGRDVWCPIEWHYLHHKAADNGGGKKKLRDFEAVQMHLVSLFRGEDQNISIGG